MALLGLIFWGAKIMAYPNVLQLFNDEIYPERISVPKSLIQVDIYEIYGTKWGPAPEFTLGGEAWTPASPLRRLWFRYSYSKLL